MVACLQLTPHGKGIIAVPHVYPLLLSVENVNSSEEVERVRTEARKQLRQVRKRADNITDSTVLIGERKVEMTPGRSHVVFGTATIETIIDVVCTIPLRCRPAAKVSN